MRTCTAPGPGVFQESVAAPRPDKHCVITAGVIEIDELCANNAAVCPRIQTKVRYRNMAIIVARQLNPRPGRKHPIVDRNYGDS